MGIKCGSEQYRRIEIIRKELKAVKDKLDSILAMLFVLESADPGDMPKDI